MRDKEGDCRGEEVSRTEQAFVTCSPSLLLCLADIVIALYCYCYCVILYCYCYCVVLWICNNLLKPPKLVKSCVRKQFKTATLV